MIIQLVRNHLSPYQSHASFFTHEKKKKRLFLELFNTVVSIRYFVRDNFHGANEKQRNGNVPRNGAKSRGPISRDCLRPFGGAILVEKSFFEGARIFFQLLPEKEMRLSFLQL